MKITVIGTSYEAFVFGPSLTNIATTSCVWNPEAIQVAAHFVQDFPALSCSQHQTASLEGTNAVNIATKRKKMRSPNNATVIENLKSAVIVDGDSLYDPSLLHSLISEHFALAIKPCLPSVICRLARRTIRH